MRIRIVKAVSAEDVVVCNVRPSDCVLDLCRQVRSATGIPVTSQCLLRGSALLNHSSLLSNLSLCEDAIINLLVKPRLQVCSHPYGNAVAAIKADGTVVTWGAS